MAMDDFLSFKKMMEKRNIELEVEAMRFVSIKYTATDHRY